MSSPKAARPVVTAVAVSVLAVSVQAGAVTAAPAAPPSSVSAVTAPAVTVPAAPVLADGGSLTNLTNLDFLLDTVPLAPVPGHTTYQLEQDPAAEAPWTYADKNDDGSYTRVGGGNLDPATGDWTQGAYNADDIARTAVVYLRHWKQTGDPAALDALLVQPLISTVSVSGSGGDSTLYVSAAKSTTVQKVTVPEGFVLVQRQYDSTGQPVKGSKDNAGTTSGHVTVAPGGFTLVTLTAG